MKPVTQTEIGVENPRANCLMACVASILEVSLDDLPDVAALEAEGVYWFAALQRALLPHGYVPVSFGDHLSGGSAAGVAPIGYHIAVGKSPRSNQVHAVVALNGLIVHDPHPSRDGLDGPVSYWILVIPWVHAAGLVALFAPLAERAL